MGIAYFTTFGKSLTLSGTEQYPTATIQPFFMRKSYSDRVTNQYSSRPLSMGFACKRTISEMDDSVRALYQKIFDQTIQHDLAYQPWCENGRDKGECAFFRGALSECKCGPLNRQAYPEFRGEFEDQVIAQVVNIVQTTRTNDLKLALFATGGLHGELILMVKLIKALQDCNFEGTIRLFLIDEIYKPNIEQAEQDAKEGECSFGGRDDLEQFLRELTLGLPSTIELRGDLFYSADDYIATAQGMPSYQCDFVAGADTETNGSVMGEIVKGAQKRKITGIALEKFNNIPQICEIDSNGAITPCKPLNQQTNSSCILM